jgi:uncharacterized protein (TIGR02466 family)
MALMFNTHGVFPTPVVFTNIDREFTVKEKKYLEEQGKNTHSNMGNLTSNYRYILRDKEMKDIAKSIDEAVDYFFQNIMSPKHKDVKLYTTQSWLNYTEEGQYHHKHSHPNSIVSGVFYIDSDPENDKIFFYKDGYKQIKFPSENFNPFNSESWWFPVKTGDIILFPSHFTHMVETKNGKNRRTSLAFNTFAKGYIGMEEELTALHL